MACNQLGTLSMTATRKKFLCRLIAHQRKGQAEEDIDSSSKYRSEEVQPM